MQIFKNNYIKEYMFFKYSDITDFTFCVTDFYRYFGKLGIIHTVLNIRSQKEWILDTGKYTSTANRHFYD